MNFKSAISLGAGFSTFILAAVSFQAPAQAQFGMRAPLNLECRFVYPIEQAFLTQHLAAPKRDSALQDRVIQQYIRRLDPTKFYLLQSDVAEIRASMTKLFELTRAQKCEIFREAHHTLIKRVKERAEFAKKMLTPGFQLDEKIEFIFDPEKSEFPATTEAANDFISKYVHFQMANHLATDMQLQEALDNVRRSWDRNIKRLEETKEEDLLAAYLDSFARALDPHSSFMPRENNEDFKISMSLSLQGIGATLSWQDGFTVIDSLVPGGPAAKSGELQPQDKIIAVGQGEKGIMENVVEMELRDVVRKIRGPKGSTVRLTILRQEAGGRKRFNVSIVRDQIRLEDQAVSIRYQERELNGRKLKIGLIDYPSFYSEGRRGGRSSAADLKRVLAEAREQKVDGIVLDLSSNGGGSLEDAVRSAGLFFRTGNVVKQVTKEDPTGNSNVLRDNDPAVDWAGPLVILVSRVSASASEILAGTLQDYQRAVVVGSTHTFGKGTVQTVMDIPPNSGDFGAIKITVGRFYIPSGVSTQHAGVSSHIIIPQATDVDEIGEKSLDFSLPPSRIPAFLSSEAFVKEGPGAWTPIRNDWLKSLAERSAVRVKANNEFAKIVEERTKAQESGKRIRIAEILSNEKKNDREKARRSRSRNRPADEKEAEYLKRPDIQESINILVDLIDLKSSGKVARKD